MRRLPAFCSVALAATVFVGFAVAQEKGTAKKAAPAKEEPKEEKINADQLPKAVAASVTARFPGLEYTSITKETEADGSVVFDIELKQKGRKFETDVKADGTIMEVEKEVAKENWPKALAKLVESKYPKATIQEVLEVNLVKDKKEIPDHLEITLELADKQAKEILTSLDGTKVTEEPPPEPAKPEPGKK